MDKLCRLIEKADVISFDIFDTLIIRLYRSPTDLFMHLEQAFRVPGFKEARISGEIAAREAASKRGVHEVTLDEIYEELHVSYRSMKQLEIQLEKQMCRANPEMKTVYDEAVERGIPVFISSDMYLPKDVVEDILSSAGFFGYQKLLISSETRRPKASGELYDDLIALSGVPADRILHIGDHRFTDYQMALNSGLNAYCYEPIRQTVGGDLNSAFFAVLNQYTERLPALSILEGLITAYTVGGGSQNYWEAFGFKYIGIVAYGYMKWLKERLDQLKISRVYFMLRDGYIMKRVFDELFPDFETCELYGSRRLFLLSGMECYQDVQSNVTGLHTKGITYAEFWDRLSLDDPEFKARYLEKFPMQGQIITGDEQVRELDSFMEEHEPFLLRAGMEERQAIGAYLDEIKLLEGPAAVVDLGWKGSMLKGLEGTCDRLNKQSDLIGFYLGTHKCRTAHMRMESYLLDHGVSTGAQNADVLLDYGFLIPILELAFTAPHPSVLKLKNSDGVITPVYQDCGVHEKERIDISRHILSGVLDFVKEMDAIDRVFPIPVPREAVLAPMEYLSRAISKTDQFELQKVYLFPGMGNAAQCRPIFRQGAPVIGVINPWPGDMSAESEVLARLKRAAEDNQVGYVMLDNFGHVLDEEQKATDQYVDEESLSFVITTHYETAKVLNAFHYHTLWNPPEIPMNLDYYVQRITDQYIMNDDYLIYDSGGMSNHLQSMLLNCPRTLTGASELTASFPISSMLPPRLEAPTMFYCGMNWEKTVNGTNRHEGLFQLLDDTGAVKFYGPEVVEAWGGLKPWEGYKCYQRPIPFDGFSILKEINRCGICLVLSSDIHRRAGAATNRTYEACAAGAVIISDDNEFMLKYFGDAALFIVYNKNNPKDTFRQIMEKYDWIVSHPDEALELAKRSQKIFMERFSLDRQLNRLIENHPKRLAQIACDLYAKDNTQKVLVTYVLNTQNAAQAEPLLDQVFQNIHGQFYAAIELAIAVDHSIWNDVNSYCAHRCACANVVGMELFDKKGSRRLTDGQAVRRLQTCVPHAYYINTTAEERWFFDHITSLVRCLENSNSDIMCAYAGSAFQDDKGYRRINFFDALHTEHLFYHTKPDRPLASGQFLFRQEAHGLLPDFLFDSIDGWEHIAYANVLHYKYKQELGFSRRMSLAFLEEGRDVRETVVPREMQMRFIQDLVHFELPEHHVETAVVSAQTEIATKRSVTDMLLLLPLKNYIRLRYYRFRMRRLAPESNRYKSFEHKYNSVLAQYNSFWA